MGSWGSGVFDNDTAADWAYGLHSGGVSYVAAALRTAVDSGDFLDSDEGAEALAAAETVARLRDPAWEPSPYSEAVDEWVRAQSGEVPADLAVLAAAAVRRVLSAGSELADLWEEAGADESAEWRRNLEDLVGRLDI